MNFSTVANINIISSEALDAKTLHHLRARLESALDETVDSVLAEFDIHNEEIHAVNVEEIEGEEEET